MGQVAGPPLCAGLYPSRPAHISFVTTWQRDRRHKREAARWRMWRVVLDSLTLTLKVYSRVVSAIPRSAYPASYFIYRNPYARTGATCYTAIRRARPEGEADARASRRYAALSYDVTKTTHDSVDTTPCGSRAGGAARRDPDLTGPGRTAVPCVPMAYGAELSCRGSA